MACTPQANMLTANSCKFSSSPTNNLFLFNRYQKDSNKRKCSLKFFRIRASSDDETDCNVEECAPDKEVGKVSMEWLAGEKTKVLGTFPPRNRGWTGYVEEDTAGQTNIYSVEPTVYVAESAISSGTAGSSADGSENTLAAVAGVALATIAAASLILLQVDKKSPPQIQTVEYSGPSLSYYINKFKPSEMVGASVPTEPETMISVQSERPKGTSPDVFSIQVESAYQVEDVLS